MQYFKYFCLIFHFYYIIFIVVIPKAENILKRQIHLHIQNMLMVTQRGLF